MVTLRNNQPQPEEGQIRETGDQAVDYGHRTREINGAIVQAPTPSSTRSTQWSDGLQQILDQPASHLPVKMMLSGVVFCGLFFTWAWCSQVDDVAVAQGKLIPRTEARKVQHDDAGKVVQLLIKEGDPVKAGQKIMELDTERAQGEVDRLKTLLSAHETELLQTRGLLQQLDLQAETKSQIAGTEVDAQRVASEQNQIAIDTQQQMMKQLESTAKLRRNRLQKLEEGRQAGAISEEYIMSRQEELQEVQRRMTESQSLIDRSTSEITRLQAGMLQKQAEVERTKLESQQQKEQLRIRITELEAKVNETKVLMSKATAEVKRRFVYAPTSGEVLNMNVRQTGQVIQPGEVLAEIAPQGQPLILSAWLPAQEAGFVKEGIPVKVKMEAFAYQDYGIISGKVHKIGRDSQTIDKVGQMYRVDIVLDQTSIKAKGEQIKFKPGQLGIAEIVTRKRRMLDVLIDPIKQMQADNVNL
jgi:hemolysin D